VLSGEKEMKVFLKLGILPLVVVIAGAATSPAVRAQSQPSPAPSTPSSAPSDPSIAQRKENQQDRIASGVQSGQLTAGETANLEKKESAINAETKADRSANGGKLTTAEKSQINGQQSKLSNQIYQDKHNANTASYGNNEVGQRRQNQQARIAQGIKSGQLTAGETAKLENQQKGINHQVAADRKANGGTLTASQKTQINHEQNQASKNIYNKKHNGRTQGTASPK
jgi:hypothetical protein